MYNFCEQGHCFCLLCGELNLQVWRGNLIGVDQRDAASGDVLRRRDEKLSSWLEVEVQWLHDGWQLNDVTGVKPAVGDDTLMAIH